MTTMGLPLQGEPGRTEADPYAEIRRLNLTRMGAEQYNYGGLEQEAQPYWYIGSPDGNYDQRFQPGSGFGFQSKYNNVTDLGDGRVSVTMQQPGLHKYDTMDVIYRLDPASGQYVMEGNPSPTRQVSSGEEWRDTIEPIAAVALAAGAAYAGGSYLAAGEAGAGAGAMTTSEKIALMSANGMTDAEIAATLAASGDTAGAATLTGSGFGVPAGGSAPPAGSNTPPSASNTPSGGRVSNPVSALQNIYNGTATGADYWEAIKAGFNVYGMYQGQDAVNRAGDQADRQIDLATLIADRQAGLAESAYDNYLNKIQPGLLEDAQWARDRAQTTAGQADQLFGAQFEDASRYRDRYWGVQIPREDELYQTATDMGSRGGQDAAAGRATTELEGQYSMARDAAQRQNARMGINPGSGMAQALAQDAFMSAALGKAGAATSERNRTLMDSINLRGNLAALGRGLPGMVATSSSGANASGGLGGSTASTPVNATATASNANTSAFNGMSNMWNSSLNALGTGYNAAANYATLVNNSPLSTVAGYGWSDWLGKKP